MYSLTLCFNLLLQNELKQPDRLTRRHSHSHHWTRTHSRILSPPHNEMPYFIYMACIFTFRGFLCHPYPSLISLHLIRASGYILNPAGVPIVLVLILGGGILYATTRSVHHMGELLQPAAWQTLITAGVSLD